MSYEYVKRAYRVEPHVGERVQHNETKRWGVIQPENLSQAHYVQVLFDDCDFPLPCHPRALDYPEAPSHD
jgi:hypothetical protein